ncbi:MAG: 23S rRNA (adenine(2503)-C(2))-methyltransferase RlmN [Gammaproteobacteria bacterium]|nr:23S rRNA (adenine(2503)-C(2))-methyltransferase RlmN [Gammaproteobacteria bacterium]
MEATSPRTSLFGLSRAQMKEFLLGFDDRPFRAQQLMKWVYHEREYDVMEMTNLSKSFRSALAEVSEAELPSVLRQSTSGDGTTKWVVGTKDGGAVECVLIPDGRRNTLCISSQRGCSLDCAFCATGKQGFAGNLLVEDIVGQVVQAQTWLEGDPARGELTNIVFMGMGEPLMNFEAVMTATDIFMDDLAFGISKRRVTISTAGVVPRIYDMCGRTEASLAVSLHAPNDDLRSFLVPINKKYPVADLLEACRAYLGSLSDRRIVTFEYTLIDGVNDSNAIARDLAKLLRDFRCKVNLISFNPIALADFRRPSMENVRSFQRTLIDNGLMVTYRTTRGSDIDAACGQLVGQFADRTKRRDRYSAVQQPSM